MPNNISTNITFPDIAPIIYEETKSLDNIRTKYIKLLRESGLMHNILYANKLEESAEMLKRKNLREFEKLVKEFQIFLETFCKKNNVALTFRYRQKDFIRLNDKIRLKLINNKPLDTVRDLLGFRITLNTPPKDSLDTVNLCYMLLEEVINFFVIQKHGIPLEDDVPKTTNFIPENYPNIVRPAKSGIPEEFKSYAKDYIYFIKNKGYQSLHIVIKMPNGLKFEIQMRTFAMDIVAEKGSASHKGYEDERRNPSDIAIDYSKVQLPGFCYLPDGEKYDMSGLSRAIDPLTYL